MIINPTPPRSVEDRIFWRAREVHIGAWTGYAVPVGPAVMESFRADYGTLIFVPNVAPETL